MLHATGAGVLFNFGGIGVDIMFVDHAIFTKYLQPTNTRGSRIKAWFAYGKQTHTMPFMYEIANETRHTVVALALIEISNPALEIIASADIPEGMVFIVRENRERVI